MYVFNWFDKMKHLAYYILILSQSFFDSSRVAAQEIPEWIDPQNRELTYSDILYFKGFASEFVANSKEKNRVLKQISEIAKAQLIQSIQVSIRSESSYQLENVNTQTQETFQQQTASLSQANIVGLEIKTFYYKKKKTAYAFAHANKEEIRAYYQKDIEKQHREITNKLHIAEQSLENRDKELGLKNLYACLPLFSQINRDQTLLIAMGIKSDAILKINETHIQRQRVEEGISVLSRSHLNMEELAYLLALNISIQIDKLENPLYLGFFSFQDTEEHTDFSIQFRQVLKKKLVEVGNYSVHDEPYQRYSITGTYWDQENAIKILFNLKNSTTNKILAAVEGTLSHEWLEKNRVAYIPEFFKKLQLINHIVLETSSSRVLKGKIGSSLKNPLIVQVFKSEESLKLPLKNIPVRFYFTENEQKIDVIQSDKDGFARCIPNKLGSDGRIQIIKAELDLPTYLALDSKSDFYQKISKNYKIPSIRFIIEVSNLSAYFESSEMNMSQPLSTKFIEPKLKDALSDKGFEFVKDIDSSDYFISIRANSRKGRNFNTSELTDGIFSGLYFGFVDATVSIIDMNTGKEIYKNAYSDIKGGGANYQQAGIKAYKAASEKIATELTKELTIRR